MFLRNFFPKTQQNSIYLSISLYLLFLLLNPPFLLIMCALSSTESFEQTVKERFSAQSRPNEVRKLLNGNVVSSASHGHSLCGNKTNVGCSFNLVGTLDRVFLQTVITRDLLRTGIKKFVMNVRRLSGRRILMPFDYRKCTKLDFLNFPFSGT